RAMSAPPPPPAAVAGTATAAAANTRATAALRPSDARLEIVPPSANSARRAGTQSGIDAGGEGDMLRQQLQQTRESLAARDAEVQELKARIADLEQLQRDQQKLLSMKDNQLASVQQNLATGQAVTPVATTASATSTNPSAAQGPLLWLWIVATLVLVLLGAWLLLRRRAARPAQPIFDTTPRTAGLPVAERFPVARVPTATPSAAPVTAAPTWHDPSQSTLASLVPESPSTTGAAVPDVLASDAYMATSLNPAPAGHERIELARAYIDLGDTDTARSLLQEVAEGGDAAARDEATRLLRDLL
ncbi:MAG: FimV/HubP family polar landmark protein, partial [Luteimonas sp.]